MQAFHLLLQYSAVVCVQLAPVRILTTTSIWHAVTAESKSSVVWNYFTTVNENVANSDIQTLKTKWKKKHKKENTDASSAPILPTLRQSSLSESFQRGREYPSIYSKINVLVKLIKYSILYSDIQLVYWAHWKIFPLLWVMPIAHCRCCCYVQIRQNVFSTVNSVILTHY